MIAAVQERSHSSFDRSDSQQRATDSHSNSAGSTLASGVDDRLYAFEAAGLLLGQEELPAEQQLAAVDGVLRPLLAQIALQLPLAVRSLWVQAAVEQV